MGRICNGGGFEKMTFNLSEQIEAIDKIIYAHEGSKKILGVKGITGEVIFKDDVKEFIKKLKEEFPMILPLQQKLGCDLIHIHTIIDKLAGKDLI